MTELSCRDFAVLSSSRRIFGYRALQVKQQLYRKSCYQVDMGKKLLKNKGSIKLFGSMNKAKGPFLISSAPVLILLGWPMLSH